MRFNDLSSDLAPIVCIRFESVVYNFGKVNQPGKALCEQILQKDYNLYLITLLEERKAKAWCYKWGVIYTAILGAETTFEIPEIVWANKVTLYIDTDDRLLEVISSRGNPQTITQKWTQELDDGPATRNTYPTS